MDITTISDRIKTVAKNADGLIVRLDTLSNRIDTARINENSELVEYYENQFAEASAEFMDSVETILDGWYALHGEKRPLVGEEEITPEMIDEIHGTVVSIVQGLPVDLPEFGSVRNLEMAAEDKEGTESSPEVLLSGRKKTSRNRVDLTG